MTKSGRGESGLRSRAQNSAHCDRMRIADAVGGCFGRLNSGMGSALSCRRKKMLLMLFGALVCGVFSAMSFVGRLAADPIREKVGSFRAYRDRFVVGPFRNAYGSFAESAYLCLFGYGVMGIGLEPVVPTLFSLAGSSSRNFSSTG